MRVLLVVLTLVLATLQATGQTVVLDSVVRATGVTEIFTGTCDWAVAVGSTDGFMPGDRVLLHQAKGAVCAQIAPTDSGEILLQGQAGAFEFNWVRSVFRDRVFLTDSIGVEFDPSAGVQLIKVIYADQLLLQGTITAKPWDGVSGGVVAIEAAESVTVDGSTVSVSGLGFRGGDMSMDNITCSLATAMHAPAPSDLYGTKGEGISSYRAGAEAGRAAVANGGGGGGNHNSGGGGGSNAGSGGRGGIHWAGCTGRENTFGLGGWPTTLDRADPRLLFGGGGGGAHQDEARLGTSGASGAGAMIVRAPAVVFANRARLVADGASVTIVAEHNGAAGGGGGGTVLIACDTISGSGSLSANGGNGGDVDRSDPQPCGPGGGGGGGHIALTLPQLPPTITTSLLKGRSGENTGRTGTALLWYAESGERGQTTFDVVFPGKPPASGPRLISDGDRDLGLRLPGSTIRTRFVVHNIGDEPALITGILFIESRLREVSTDPLPPVTLFKGDSLVTIADALVQGGPEVDTLVLDVNNQCGVVPTIVAARSWRSVQDTVCVAVLNVIADTFALGFSGRVGLVLNTPNNVTSGSTFRVGIAADRTVLHLRETTIRARQGVTASIVDYAMYADTAVVIVEGEYDQPSPFPLDTLFTLDAMALFSARSSTEVFAYAAEPFTLDPPCTAVTNPVLVDVGEVCSTRQLRTVTIGGPSGARVRVAEDGIRIDVESGWLHPVPWSVHTIHGAEVARGVLLSGSTLVPLAHGAYLVSLGNDPSAGTSLIMY